MTELEYYKSPQGIYVARNHIDYLNRRDKISNREFRINGVKPEPTHHTAWVFVPGATSVESLEVLGHSKPINYRWVRDAHTPPPIVALTPAEISGADAHEYYDDDYEDTVIGSECEWYDYRAFFTRTFDRSEAEFEPQDFTATLLGEVQTSDVSKPTMQYKVLGQYRKEAQLSLDNIASYDELAHMLTTDLLIHHQPCSVSSTTTFNIVRKHVLDNINPKWAVVTSDYDFCFTVKKKVAVKPYTRQHEEKKANGKSYARPRITTHAVDHKQVSIFEMTHSPKNYNGYTPIKGFRGDNLQDLADNIERYLTELMDHINAPLSECPHCEGMGHVMQDTFNMNGERT